MIRLCVLFRLMALFAFVVSTLGATSTGYARVADERAVGSNCPDHAPPPAPCPAKDTAKHAAGDCCALMASVLAVLPLVADGDLIGSLRAPVTKPVRSLAGHVSTKDPPPPRV